MFVKLQLPVNTHWFIDMAQESFDGNSERSDIVLLDTLELMLDSCFILCP